MKKVYCVILVFLVSLFSSCGNSTQPNHIDTSHNYSVHFTDDEISDIADSVSASMSSFLSSYGLRCSVSIEEDYEYDSHVYDAKLLASVHVPGLSKKPIVCQAEIADYILNSFKETDIIGYYGYGLYDVTFGRFLYGDNGEYSMTENDGSVTLSEGNTTLIPGETWGTIKAEYLMTPDGELSYEQWFHQKNPICESLKVGYYYHLDLPFVDSESLLSDKEFLSALYSYCNMNLQSKKCNYFSISFPDGRGIVFFGGDMYNNNYGSMSSIDHTLRSQLGYLEIKNDGFRYEKFTD